MVHTIVDPQLTFVLVGEITFQACEKEMGRTATFVTIGQDVTKKHCMICPPYKSSSWIHVKILAAKMMDIHFSGNWRTGGWCKWAH